MPAAPDAPRDPLAQIHRRPITKVNSRGPAVPDWSRPLYRDRHGSVARASARTQAGPCRRILAGPSRGSEPQRGLTQDSAPRWLATCYDLRWLLQYPREWLRIRPDRRAHLVGRDGADRARPCRSSRPGHPDLGLVTAFAAARGIPVVGTNAILEGHDDLDYGGVVRHGPGADPGPRAIQPLYLGNSARCSPLARSALSPSPPG